jgi:4-hydroxy-4-methyl-2-oxoglutarate aldolase
MLDDPPLLTIQSRFTRPDPAKVAALRGAQTSHLVDAMDGRGALDWTIKPMDPGNARFAGVAVTCHAYPADNLAMFGAMEIAQAGDVIVCANECYKVTAVIGDLVAGMMKNAGIEAFVTDGLGRDRAGIIAAGLPLFCAGIVPNSPAKNGPGSVGLPVTVAGVPVSAGDVIVATPMASWSCRRRSSTAPSGALPKCARPRQRPRQRSRREAGCRKAPRRF